ncbi:MAG TPA: glycoside hydrolase family 43 protein [Chitinispirillaceae bacterium]|nr:glycoside hydrolase family 43 protein [Chitinispirillaceae bacterium]
MTLLNNAKSITVSIYLLFFSIQSTSAADSFTAYLFAYFTGNSKTQEAIRFALSNDAHNFKALNNNNPVISSEKISSTGGVRDPHILRGENDDYYMVATDMVSANGWASNRGLVMLRSTNLIDWTSSAVNIPQTFPAYSAADRVWAPQVIYDKTVGKYMVYFAMRLGPNVTDKIYYAFADSTFTHFESTPKLLYSYNSNAAIDADIICKDSTYYLFFKTEGSGNGIKSATSRNLTEGYILYDKYLQATTAAVEGSCVFPLIDSDTFVLMYDVYTSGKYEFAVSTDLRNFKKDPLPISFDFTPRHGTVIPITEKEKKNLLAKWDPARAMTKSSIWNQSAGVRLHGTTLELILNNRETSGSISLVDISGRDVLRQTIQGKVTRISMSSAPAGLFHVMLNTGRGNRSCTRIIVK